MPSKGAKSKSDSKPKSGKRKSSAKKKTKAQIKKQLALKEAKAQVKILKSAVKDLQTHLKAERAQGVFDPVILRVELSKTQKRFEEVQLTLTQAKAVSRKRKDEIDAWKAWYEKLPNESKPAGIVTLQSEIAWRAAELDSNALIINQLMMEEITSRGMLENTKHKLMALEAGVHKLPIEKDPRLKGAQKRLNNALAKVAKLTFKRAKKK